jgi:hypothetical protein
MIEIYPVHQPGFGKNLKMTKQTHFAAIPSVIYDYLCRHPFAQIPVNYAETMKPQFKFEYNIAGLRVKPKNRICDRALTY